MNGETIVASIRIYGIALQSRRGRPGVFPWQETLLGRPAESARLWFAAIGAASQSGPVDGRARRGVIGLRNRARVATSPSGLIDAYGIPGRLVKSREVLGGSGSQLDGTFYGNCRASGLATPSVSEGLQPPFGDGFFYLITGVKDGIEGLRGFQSNGSRRNSLNVCP